MGIKVRQVTWVQREKRGHQVIMVSQVIMELKVTRATKETKVTKVKQVFQEQMEIRDKRATTAIPVQLVM
jgi:hypothetical protein